jgi:transcriptional regulator with XRE-family HTH domain
VSAVSASHRRRRASTLITGPDPVDIHVGARIRLRRALLGLTQTELADAIGLTFQQVQKYERGSNRVSASMLHRIAGVLDVPVSFFFDDMADEMKLPPPGQDDVLARPETCTLLRHYYRLPDPLRQCVHDLIKAMARNDH